MLGDGAPLPVTAETPARILRTVEKENSYGGRRLSSATISKGGVTVRGKGVLEVLDGGSLEIVTGNLKLLAGTLPATAKKTMPPRSCEKRARNGRKPAANMKRRACKCTGRLNSLPPA